MYKKYLIFYHVGNGFLESIEEIKNDIQEVPMYIQGKDQRVLPPGYISMDEFMRKALPVPVCKSARAEVTATTSVCYIFTSGTTGSAMNMSII